MALELMVLYRGPLSSCNYDCHYCPFAKHHETASELRVDRQQLERFVDWVESREDDQLSILFTPWGEALTRRWYRDAITRLSHLAQIRKVAIQTNLSWETEWLSECSREHVGLWCTWHPDQVDLATFVRHCRQLDRQRVRYSAGMVGLREYYAPAQDLRSALAEDVYLWINAYKDEPDYYSDSDIARWRSIDPLFDHNLNRYASFGRACNAGSKVVSIDGDGTLRRCHFIKQPIGNIYEQRVEDCLKPRMCTNQTCGCHIGYIHMPSLNLYPVYGDGILERIPVR